MSKHLITLFALFLTSGAMAISTADTTAKFSVSSLKSLYVSDYSNSMAIVLDYFNKDSIDKAIPLFYQSMLSADREKNILKANGYHFQEMVSIAGIYTDRKLTAREAEQTRWLFKQLFNPAVEEESSPFNKPSKVQPSSVFEKRINLFVSTFESPKIVEPKIDKLLKESPGLLNIRLLKSELQFRGKYADCISSCSELLKINPRLSYCYNLRGVAYLRLKQYELAISDFKQAQSHCPDYFQASINLANTCIDAEKYSDAVIHLRTLLDKLPFYEPAKYNLARSYYNLDSLDSALVYIDEYIRSNPEEARAHDFRGDIYYDMDKYPEAINNYSYAIKLAPENSYYYSGRGAALYYSNKTEDALADFMKSYEFDKTRKYTIDKIGDCYYRKEDYNTAITWYKKALKIDPNYKYSLVSIGNVYAHLKKYGTAVAAFEKAIKADSTYSDALGDLGWTYYLAGNYPKSIEYSYKALKYDEEAVYAMFNIPLAVLRSGDFERAKQLYEHFIKLCGEKNLEITEGAVTDLEDLIKENVLVEQAKAILKAYFKKG